MLQFFAQHVSIATGSSSGTYSFLRLKAIQTACFSIYWKCVWVILYILWVIVYILSVMDHTHLVGDGCSTVSITLSIYTAIHTHFQYILKQAVCVAFNLNL
jgi:hypothetical protein